MTGPSSTPAPSSRSAATAPPCYLSSFPDGTNPPTRRVGCSRFARHTWMGCADLHFAIWRGVLLAVKNREHDKCPQATQSRNFFLGRRFTLYSAIGGRTGRNRATPALSLPEAPAAGSPATCAASSRSCARTRRRCASPRSRPARRRRQQAAACPTPTLCACWARGSSTAARTRRRCTLGPAGRWRTSACRSWTHRRWVPALLPPCCAAASCAARTRASRTRARVLPRHRGRQPHSSHGHTLLPCACPCCRARARRRGRALQSANQPFHFESDPQLAAIRLVHNGEVPERVPPHRKRAGVSMHLRERERVVCERERERERASEREREK